MSDIRQPTPGGALFDHGECTKAFEQWCKNSGILSADKAHLVEAFYQGWFHHEKHLHYSKV